MYESVVWTSESVTCGTEDMQLFSYLLFHILKTSLRSLGRQEDSWNSFLSSKKACVPQHPTFLEVVLQFSMVRGKSERERSLPPSLSAPEEWHHFYSSQH